jgi:Domain of unknown function (DUF1127)
MHNISTAGARCAGSALSLVLRRAFARLDALDDHLLHDIGLTRADIANYRGSSPVPHARSQIKRLEGLKKCMTL